MSGDYESIKAHQRSIGQVVPLLEGIRSVAEIALRRAEERLPPLARYAERVDAELAALQGIAEGGLPDADAPSARTAFVVVSSQRGLCGAFNQRLVNRVREQMQKKRDAGEEVDLICLGRQGQRLFEAAKESLVYSSGMPSFALPAYLDIERIAVDVLDLMEARAIGRLVVVHNAPLRRFQYDVVSQQLFPVPIDGNAGRRRPQPGVKPPDDAGNLLTHLITERVLIDMYRAVVQSAISEELARVAAMRLAVDNARHLLDDLTAEANRMRQIEETNALLEIISGFRAASPGGI